MTKRQEYEITDEQFETLMNACKPVAALMIGGTLPSSQQENANAAWSRLGDKMGFDSTTVEPVANKSSKFFTAEPTKKITGNTTPTIENVKTLFKDRMPSRGGYSSWFEYEQGDGVVEVTFLAEWLPRYLKFEFVVLNVDTDNDTLTFSDNGNTETKKVKSFLQNECGDYGS